MIEHDYSQSKYDSCVYHQKLNDGSFVYLFLYVNDILIIVKNICELDKLKAQLIQAFEMKDLKAAKKILGMKIHKNR